MLLKLFCEARSIIKLKEYADKVDKEFCGKGEQVYYEDFEIMCEKL
jgi:hypothetical protein